MQLHKNIKIKGKNIALTSIKSFNDIRTQKIIKKQHQLVLIFLSEIREATSREIALRLNLERTSITRTLFNLKEEGKIIISDVRKCPTTNRSVRWYSITTQNENND